MRKRILSIALTLCMMLAVLPTAVTVLATTPTGTALTQNNIGNYTALTGGSTESETAYYYLSENIDVYQTLTVTGYVTLDLNGKALQQTKDQRWGLYGVNIVIIGTDDTSGYLTITDSCGEGKIDIKYQDQGQGYLGNAFWVVNGSATLNSGEIAFSQIPAYIKINENASMTINGGKITNAKCSFRNFGILYANGGKVELSEFYNVSNSKITHTDGVTTFTTFEISDQFSNANSGEINWGIFNCNSDWVYNESTISGGIFNCNIEESGTITGGLFKTAPSGYETWDVTFKPENGEADSTYKAVKNTTVTPLTAPVKDGFTFAGWYEKDNGKFKANAFDFDSTKVTGDITLYAKWVCAGEHTGGTATCTDKAVCTVCGEEYGEVDAENHTDEKEWTTKNETKHEQKWKCCGATVVALENHEWKDGVCEECGYVCVHTGGIADCTHKAKCEVCGAEYGEVNADKHTTLKHIEAKAATTEAEGNIEYWYCEECGKYFSDKDGKNEIKLADTVIAKLEKTETPKTGDNTHIALWIVLFLVSGGTLAGITVYSKKKKRFVK